VWSKRNGGGTLFTRFGVNEDKWYEEATKSRARWRALCHSGVAARQDEIQEAHGHRTVNNVVCEVCCTPIGSLEKGVIRKGTSV